MREIKFRAWDKRYRTWHLWGLNVNPETGAYFTGPPHNELIHCQFTGLHDKNGKEIYEGDILKSETMRTLMTVKWWDESAGFNLAWIQGHNITVIGNIYENPELIK